MRRTVLALAALLSAPLLGGCLREIKQPPAGGASAWADSDVRPTCGFRIWSGGYYDRDRAWHDGDWVCLERPEEHASGSAEAGPKQKQPKPVVLHPEEPKRLEVDVPHGDRKGHH